MNKREQKMTTEVKKWCVANIKTLNVKKGEALIVECKVSVDNKPLNLKSGFQDHQIGDLIRMNQGVWGFKPSDAAMSYQIGDLIIGNRTKTYVAIQWVRKGNKTFYMLDPVTVQGMIDDNKKSLTEEDAAKYCEFKGILK
jgi:hypothetical protein